MAPRDPIFEALERDITEFLNIGSRRRAELTNMSVARDLGAWLIGEIPLVGQQLADAWQDNVWADMKAKMTAFEVEAYTQTTRFLPDTIALLNTFQRTPEGR